MNAEDRALYWGVLIHLSYNMWEDRIDPEREQRGYRLYLRFDESLWYDILDAMKSGGLNLMVLDLGDGIRYRSHPEIAIENAWSVEKLTEELDRLRSIGIQPVPKLNFSTCHDAWLGEYSRCVSTPVYYEVCQDLITEVAELFDSPPLFHLGMDEENYRNQRRYNHVVIRQFDLWWHDLNFLVKQVENSGSRAWVWSDYMWDNPEEFFKRMPQSVVQSNWYYSADFDEGSNRVSAYAELETHRYDQIPTGSNHSNEVNFGSTAEFCRDRIGQERLLGFLQTPWRPTIEEVRDHHLAAIGQVARAKNQFVDG